MSENKIDATNLEKFIDKKVEKRSNEVKSDLEQKLMEAASVHTESRTSKWADYEPGDGQAFREYVGGAIRARNAGSKDKTRFVDKTFAKRFVEPFESRSNPPISTDSDGGENVLEDPLFQDVLALIRTNPVVEDLGITVVPMQSDTLDLPIESEKASFAYTDEGDEIAESQYDWTQKRLQKKGLKGRVRVTNDFLESNPIAAEAYIASKLVQDATDAMNQAVVDGLPRGPEALFDGIAAGNKLELTEAGATSTDINELQEKIDEMVELVRQRDINVPKDRVKMLSSISFRNTLKRVRDNGVRVYPGLGESMMTLDGYEFIETGYIGNDYDDSLQGDNDETRIFAGDFSAYWMGILADMRLDFDESEFFSRDVVQWRLVMQHDGKVAHPDRLAVLSTDFSYTA